MLLSGGLDSVVNLCLAHQKGEVLMGLTFDYGQQASLREIEASRNVCRRYGIPHQVILLQWMQKMASSLTRGDGQVPLLSEEDLSNPSILQESARSVWVPNRNGAFINIAASLAEAMRADLIVTGFNREEAVTFPDNSREFLSAINMSLEYSTLSKVRVTSYTIDMDKKEILEAGLQHRAPLEEVWSCYLGGEKMCGKCESCMRLKQAVAGTGAACDLRDRFWEGKDSSDYKPSK